MCPDHAGQRGSRGAREGGSAGAMGEIYLYRIQPVRPEMLLESTPEEDAVIARHFAYLESLTAEGVVLLAGRTLTTDQGSFGTMRAIRARPSFQVAKPTTSHNSKAASGGQSACQSTSIRVRSRSALDTAAKTG